MIVLILDSNLQLILSSFFFFLVNSLMQKVIQTNKNSICKNNKTINMFFFAKLTMNSISL